MQKALFIAAIIFFAGNLFAQHLNTDDYANTAKQFLTSNFKLVRRPIVVAEKMPANMLTGINEMLSKDTFYTRISYDRGKTIVVDTFVFSKQERLVIDSSFAAMEAFSWTNELLPETTILKPETVDSLTQKGIYMFLSVGEHYHTNRFFWLSKPIFLRGNSICIFYDEVFNGGLLGSGGSLVIYIKKNNNWKRLKTIDEWMS